MEFTSPKKIFIIDDDQMLCEGLTDYLTRKTAHNITCFHTGEDFMQHIFENPDFVLLDFHLNTVKKDAMNGMQILEFIKKNNPKIQVIMLSSQEKYALAMQTILKGAEQYVIKDEDAFAKIYEMISKS